MRLGGERSGLRRAWLARNWTLEKVVEEIDPLRAWKHSGVTPPVCSPVPKLSAIHLRSVRAFSSCPVPERRTIVFL